MRAEHFLFNSIRLGASIMHLSPPPPLRVALTAVRSKVVVLLLFIYCSWVLHLIVPFCFWSLFCSAMLVVLSSFSNHLAEEHKMLVA